jgi:hypothetical protein
MITIIGSPLIIPIFFGLRGIFYNISTEWILYDDKLYMVTGLFSQDIVEVRYYRIKSIRMKRTFIYRLFSLGTIEIKTSEKFFSDILMNGISDWKMVFDGLQNASEYARKENGVGEQNLYMLN